MLPERQAMKDILAAYEKAFEQIINFLKSEVFF